MRDNDGWLQRCCQPYFWRFSQPVPPPKGVLTALSSILDYCTQYTLVKLPLHNETDNVEIHDNGEHVIFLNEAVEVFDLWQDLGFGGCIQSKTACQCKTWKMRKTKSKTSVNYSRISTITKISWRTTNGQYLLRTYRSRAPRY